jgi:hypothetical protein
MICCIATRRSPDSFRAAAVEHLRELGLLTLEVAVHHAGRDVDVVLGPVAEVGDELAHDHAGDDGLGYRVAAESIEAVHVPARRLTRREQAREGRALPGRRGPHAAHRVVLGRAHRDPVLGRIDAEEVVADLVHLAKVARMWCSPSSVMSSQRCSPKRMLGALALAECSSIRRETTSREASSFFSGS